MFGNIKAIIQILFICWLPPLLAADKLPITSNQPIEIESDVVLYEQNSGKITYRGKVIVINGQQTLYADTVIVKRTTNQAIESIQAFGTPAHFTSLTKDEITPINAYAAQMDYEPNRSLLVLTGKAKIVHQQDIFEGPVLKYKIDQQKIEAMHAQNERPKMIITPPNKS